MPTDCQRCTHLNECWRLLRRGDPVVCETGETADGDMVVLPRATQAIWDWLRQHEPDVVDAQLLMRTFGIRPSTAHTQLRTLARAGLLLPATYRSRGVQSYRLKQRSARGEHDHTQ